ncbi:hypothetical protein JYT48_01130 [Mariprofundus ferrooxydans]|nr:hypothetical protein [Mariprofundus ferrooxydans]
MTTIKTLSQLMIFVLLAIVAWYSWQTPIADSTSQSHLTFKMPPQSNQSDQPKPSNQHALKSTPLWRVITRRVITKAAVYALTQRLKAMRLQTIKIHSLENITMHAFDDAELFTSRKKAKIAARFWQAHNIPNNIIKAKKGVYLLSLGRFYQPVYATETQQQLLRTGRKFRYQQRSVPIPVWRFTFKAANKNKSQQLWRKLNTTGVIMPVLMSESQFQALYGSAIQSN